MKKVFLFVVRIFELLIAFIIFYLTISLIFMSIQIGEISGKGEITIYLKSDGVHTDYVFPTKTEFFDWQDVISPFDTKSKELNFNYISIGWGDKGFFLNTPKWSDLKASTVFKACFYLGGSAIHTNYIKELDFKYKHIKISISKKDYLHLVNYVLKTLKKDRKNVPICIKGRGYWVTDSFYETYGSYGLFNTCNSWINSGLKEANLPACFWTPLNSGIFHKYRN